MKIDFQKLLHRKKNAKSPGLSAGFRINPAREWAIGIGIIVSVLIGGLFYAAHLFLTEIETEYFDIATRDVQAEVYKHATVEKALTEYEARAAASAVIRGAAPVAPVRVDEATTTETAEEGAGEVAEEGTGE